MKLHFVIATSAIVTMMATLTSPAYAQSDTNTSPTIVINNESQAHATNTNDVSAGAAAKAATGPITTVDKAAAAFDAKTNSRIEHIRQTRQDAETETSEAVEAKIEQSRLKDEEQRVQRLFGDHPDQPAANGSAPAKNVDIQQNAPVIIFSPAPVPAPITLPPTPTPVVPAAETKAPEKTPALPAAPVPPVPVAAPVPPPAPVAPAPAPAPVKQENVQVQAPIIIEPANENKADVKPAAPNRKFYVGGILALPQYSANNVKTNFALGVSVGSLLDEHSAVELSLLYSDYYIDTFWRYGLYSELTQYDIQAAYKYYFTLGSFKPFVGASLSYIMRSYQDRVKTGLYYQYNSNTDSAQTNSVDAGLLFGADFNVNENFSLGLSADYNHNVMNSDNNFGSQYNLQPGDTKAIEEIDYFVVKLTAKILF